MRCATLLLACSLAACARTPVAPVVMADIEPPLECPEPEVRRAPADLLAPLEIAPPQLVPAGAGDYGIAREDAERMIEAMRQANERLSRWRAWGE